MVALYNWEATARRRRNVVLATTVALNAILICIVLCGLDSYSQFGWMQRWTVASCAVALIADCFRGHWFVRAERVGMTIYALALLLFTVALNEHLPPFWSRLLVAPSLLIIFAQVYLWRCGADANDLHWHKRAITWYGWPLALLLFSGMAGLFRPEWQYGWDWIRWLLIAKGAGLIVLAECINCHGVFVSRNRGQFSQIATLVFYHIGMLCLALGVIANTCGLY